MRNLTRRPFRRIRSLARRLGRDERGAIGILIAILLGSGVLLGMVALVVDVGLLYVEQGRLQSGADAAALAIARSCASGGCDPSLAQSYVDANDPAGGSATARLVCAEASSGTCTSGGPGPAGPAVAAVPATPAAPAAPGTSPALCPPGSPGQSFVDVSAAATLGSASLPMNFARTLLGARASFGTGRVAACGQAAWGPPATAQVTAFTVPYCVWDQATFGGRSYPPPTTASATSLTAASDVRLRLDGPLPTPAGQGCGDPGQGRFGWTEDLTGACSAQVTGPYRGAWANDAAVVPALCEQVIANAQARRTFLVIPVYASATSGNGATGYQLAGFAAFVVTGYHFPGLTASDWLDPAATCGSTATCVDGYFTRTLIPGTGTLGGQDLGAYIAVLSG